MNFCLLLNKKEDILKNFGNQTTFWLPTFVKHSDEQKKETHTGLEQHESE